MEENKNNFLTSLCRQLKGTRTPIEVVLAFAPFINKWFIFIFFSSYGDKDDIIKPCLLEYMSSNIYNIKAS